MAEPLHCKHCKPEEQKDYLIPGPWRNLYHYYDHLGVDHGILAKRHFYQDRAPSGEIVQVGERETIDECRERVASLKESLTEKKGKKRG